MWGILIFTFWACNSENNSTVEFINFGNSGMVAFQEYVFRPYDRFNTDTVAEFVKSISIIVRYSENCNIKSLPLKIEALYKADEPIITDTIKVDLFDNSGHKKGKGNFGIFQTRYLLKQNQPIDPLSFISISTSESATPGVIALGVEWEKL